MTVFQAIILGIVQGLTEFLPVSSSAHLNIFPWLFNWAAIPDSFDVALHFGTLLALCIYFFKDWIKLITSGYKQIVKKEKSVEGRLFWYIVIVTLPTGIVSLVLDKFSEEYLTGMAPIAIALIVMGIILYIVDKKANQEVDLENMTFKQSFIIGLSQALAAAFPGVSRSGITITMARAFKMDRTSSARYSFLLSAPIVLAAVVVKVTDFVFDIPFVVGVLTSFIVGLLVIKFLMKYIEKKSYKIFAIYRVIFGIIILSILFIK